MENAYLYLEILQKECHFLLALTGAIDFYTFSAFFSIQIWMNTTGDFVCDKLDSFLIKFTFFTYRLKLSVLSVGTNDVLQLYEIIIYFKSKKKTMIKMCRSLSGR